jgi:ACR3 family arsenite efflux pump ArsB
MEKNDAILALAALAQQTRLETFRALVRYEPHGLAAGDLARLLVEVPVMLSVVKIVQASRGWYEAGVHQPETKGAEARP